MPRGVHGRRPNSRRARWPTFSGWKPSTSLRGSIRWISAAGVGDARQRQLHQDAVDRGIGIEPVDQRQQFGFRGAGRQVVVERPDADLLRRAALVAHVDGEAGSPPTSTTARPGPRLPAGDARVDPRLQAVEQVFGDAACRRGCGRSSWPSGVKSCGYSPDSMPGVAVQRHLWERRKSRMGRVMHRD